MIRRFAFILLLPIIVSCNLPGAVKPEQGTIPSPTTLPVNGVVILSPQNGTLLPSGSPVQVQFTASGGPFLEVNLTVDNFAPVANMTNTDSVVTGTLTWDTPSDGAHKFTVTALTYEKEIISASVDVTIGASSPGPTAVPSLPPTSDVGLEAARQRVSQILIDKYGFNMTAPSVGRKSRQGVTTDPWTSAIYFEDWFISISLYSDGSEAVFAYPLNHADPNAHPDFIDPNEKAGSIHLCRPRGTIKLLVVFVDYQNLGVSQAEAFTALAQAVGQINGRYAEASRAVGVSTPILQIEATGAFIPPPPAMPNNLLTPDIVRAQTGYDVSQFDILTQVDLDKNNTYATAANFGSYGFAWGGCGNPPADVNMWIGLTAKNQLFEGSDARLQSTLGHELLHNMGYPIGKTGVHEWICGDGTLPDATDQCDQNLLPLLMMGWTDTDGDGVIEILDPTPYGFLPP